MNKNQPGEHEQRVENARELWDSAAASFDDAPDHGLCDVAIRAAWTELLRTLLPPVPAAILDIGCGTGSLSVVLAESGYDMTGIDVSPAMIAQAEAKARSASHAITFHIMDAAFPQLQPHQFDTIVCRHLLWSLPDIDQVLKRWTGLLKPGGCLLLIEGFWHTGAGLHPQEIVDAMPDALNRISVRNLSDQPELWGGEVTDERYAIIARV